MNNFEEFKNGFFSLFIKVDYNALGQTLGFVTLVFIFILSICFFIFSSIHFIRIFK